MGVATERSLSARPARGNRARTTSTPPAHAIEEAPRCDGCSRRSDGSSTPLRGTTEGPSVVPRKGVLEPSLRREHPSQRGASSMACAGGVDVVRARFPRAGRADKLRSVATPIEDYALIGDLQSAALISAEGAVDWLCLPRFDSPACFAAILGDAEHGCWRLAPAGAITGRSRRYRRGALVVETECGTADGAVRVIDFMARRGEGAPRLMRIVEGLRGRVAMRMDLRLRPDYGSIRPWIDPAPDGLVAVAGPDAFRLSTPVELTIEDGSVRADFIAIEGGRQRFALGWWQSYETSPPVEDADSALARTEAWWQEWSGRCRSEERRVGKEW